MLTRIPAFVLAALCAAPLLLSSCGNSQKPATATAPATTPAPQARYECPMGCAGSQSSQPGKCPTCGMALEKKS